MQGQQMINIEEHRVPKFTEHPNGFEVVSNDGSIKIVLQHTTVMNGSMESDFYSTKTWIKEESGWIEVNGTQNYSTKEAFIEVIRDNEDFTQAMRDYEEYKFNI